MKCVIYNKENHEAYKILYGIDDIFNVGDKFEVINYANEYWEYFDKDKYDYELFPFMTLEDFYKRKEDKYVF